MKVFGIVAWLLCVNFLEASTTYRAAVIQGDKDIATKEYAPFIYEAGQANVDILVLRSSKTAELLDNYDETITFVSEAAKQANLYVVAHLIEKASCQNKVEQVRSNLVFDRKGSIISVYRKPVSKLANCTSTPSNLVIFTTDFGVTFGSLMEEDIILHNEEYMKGLKNFVMTGASNEESFLNGAQFSPAAWSYENNANLISSNGIYIGKSGLKTSSGSLVIADLDKNGGSETSTVSMVNPSESYLSDDLSQYTIKPLDLEASVQGYKDTVCHGSFCCEFNVKTGAAGPKSDVSYGLAAFSGVHPFTAHHSIGVQNCAVFACAGLYKRSCELGSNNNTNIHFERISIAANFKKQTVQYPIIQSSVLPTEKITFNSNTNGNTQVTLEIVDSQNVMKFGIFERDFQKDFERFNVQRNSSDSTYDIYDYIFNEDVQEFFDYVWIRFKILLVVVSIYVLEML